MGVQRGSPSGGFRPGWVSPPGVGARGAGGQAALLCGGVRLPSGNSSISLSPIIRNIFLYCKTFKKMLIKVYLYTISYLPSSCISLCASSILFFLSGLPGAVRLGWWLCRSGVKGHWAASRLLRRKGHPNLGVVTRQSPRFSECLFL